MNIHEILDKLEDNTIELTLDEKVEVIGYIIHHLETGNRYICNILKVDNADCFIKSFPELCSTIKFYIDEGDTAISVTRITEAYPKHIYYRDAKIELMKDLLKQLSNEKDT